MTRNWDRFEDLIPHIGRVFRDEGPISDCDLCPAGFSVRSSANDELQALRGLTRLGLAAQRPWVDFGILRRISPYGAWHFAPSIMLMAYQHINRFEFFELLQIFVFDERMQVASSLQARTAALKLGDCFNGQPSVDLDIDWFSRYASFFSPIEKKAVVLFLNWLHEQWPDDPAVGASIDLFWSR